MATEIESLDFLIDEVGTELLLAISQLEQECTEWTEGTTYTPIWGHYTKVL